MTTDGVFTHGSHFAAAHCLLCFFFRQVVAGSAQISKKGLMGNETQNTQNYLMLQLLATVLRTSTLAGT